MKLPQISKVTVGVVLGLGMLAASSQSQAASLGLDFTGVETDIVNQTLSSTYSAGSDLLTVSGLGSAFEIKTGGVNYQITFGPSNLVGGDFDLTATIDGTGALSGGTVSILGKVAGLGYTTNTLLTGDLTAFGFGAAGGPLEFLFKVTGGDAAPLYGDIGGTGGIILDGSGFSGDFISNWSASFTAQADVAAVPVPAAVWLFGSGLLGLVGVARRSSKIQA